MASSLDDQAVVVADATGIIRMWNQGAETLFGHAADEAIGQTLDLIAPESFLGCEPLEAADRGR
jgi:PAS domain S-box-containing protein